MATVVTWLACDTVTGRILAELPDLRVDGSISDRLSAHTPALLQLPIPPQGTNGAPPNNWEHVTNPLAGRRMIVAELLGRPVWAGIILDRLGGTEAILDLPCVSLAGYLDARFVRDHDFAAIDEALITASLVDDANIEGIGFVVDAPTTGRTRSRTYRDIDDATVYSRLRELSAVQDGPEWHILLDWSDSTETAITKIFRVRPRIGHVAAGAPTAVFTAGSPAAVASSAGTSEARYLYAEQNSDGKGANDVVATGSGEGISRPQSDHARDEQLLTLGAPRWEHRYSPSSSIKDKATLDSHAQQALELMRRGAEAIEVTIRADQYPRLGEHWSTGDDVGYDLVGHRHPAGLVGVARAVGWDLDPHAGTIAPALLLPRQEG